MSLHTFYPIFDDVTWLRRVLPLGVKLVQLRIKGQALEVVHAHGALLIVLRILAWTGDLSQAFKLIETLQSNSLPLKSMH